MAIDVAASMLRARVLLDRAVFEASEAVHEIRANPVLPVSEPARAMLSTAVEQGRLAVRELEPLGAPLEQARAGIRERLDLIDPALHPDLGSHVDSDLIGRNQRMLRIAAERLSLHAELTDLPPGVARQRITAQLDEILRRPDQDIDETAARWVAQYIGLPPDVAPKAPARVFEPTLLEDYVEMGMTPKSNSQVRVEFDNLRIEMDRRAVEADPTASRAAFEDEVRAILARPDEDLVQADIRRISLIAGLSDRLRPAVVDAPPIGQSVPIAELGARGWDIGGPSFVRRMLFSLRMPAVHEQMLASPTVLDDTTRELVRLVARRPQELRTRDLERMSTIAHLPEHARPQLPARSLQWLADAGHGHEPGPYRHQMEALYDARDHLARTLDPDLIRKELARTRRGADPVGVMALRRGIDADAELRELSALPPGEARRRTTAELHAILARPDSEIDNAAMWRLAALAELPEDLRPAMAPPSNPAYAFNRFARSATLPAEDSWALGEIEMLRIDRDAQALDADPLVTRATVDAELRELLAVPDAELTKEQLRQIGVLTSVGDRLRASWTDVPLPFTSDLRYYGAQGWLPSPQGGTRGTLDALRFPIEHEAAIAGGLTRSDVERELVDILVRPTEQLDQSGARRLSWLARLPESLRPSMPPEYPNAGRFEDIGLRSPLPSGSYAAADLLDLGRIHVLKHVDPALLTTELRERVERGMDFDLQVLDAISMNGNPAVLAPLGLTPATLESRALNALGAVHGVRRPLHIADALTITRGRLVDPRTTDEAALKLHAQTLELIDRNLDRITGKRKDTYSNHPEYAEVGRVVANVSLLDKMRALSVAKAAEPATELLTW